MTLSIEQSSEYTGNDHWNWRAQVAGTPAELARIEKVKWFLHPSFTPSVVVSRDRAHGFALEAGGWGTFTLRAELHFVDGSDKTLRARLRLYYPEGETPPDQSTTRSGAEAAPPRSGPAPAGAQPPVEARTVYLSYSAADRSSAQALRGALETLGLKVLDGSGLDAGVAWDFAIQQLMADADATVGFVAGDLPSPWVAREITASSRAGKPTLVVAAGEDTGLTGLPPELQVLRLPRADPAALAGAAQRIAQVVQRQAPQ